MDYLSDPETLDMQMGHEIDTTSEPRTRSGSLFEGGRLSQTEHGFIYFHDVMLHWGRHGSCVSVLNIISN